MPRDLSNVESIADETAPGVSLADCIGALDANLWSASLPGIPVPMEAWLTKIDEPERSVGLFQEDSTVRVVVWVGDKMRSLRVAKRDDLKKISAWLEPQLAAQRVAAEKASAEDAYRKSLPLPGFSDVMRILKGGKRICTGGGRYSETYFMTAEKLQCEIFDEGHTETRDASEADLRQVIELYPDAFREHL